MSDFLAWRRTEIAVRADKVWAERKKLLAEQKKNDSLVSSVMSSEPLTERREERTEELVAGSWA